MSSAVIQFVNGLKSRYRDEQNKAAQKLFLYVKTELREMPQSAQRLIDETRDLLDTELTSMAGESYERAYGAMVCVQMLAELEEVIQYKLIPENTNKT